MGDFKNLLVWRKAHALALHVHQAAASIRGSQNAGLRNQMTRAAQSIAANIVEGRAQVTDREFARFLGYSLRSAFELEYHLIVARDTSLMTEAEFNRLRDELAEVRRMLHGLITRLNQPA